MRPGMESLSDGIDWAMVAQAREPHPERLHLVEDERRARRKAADAAYYQANKEEMRRYDKAYAASHREKRREAARRWQARFKAEHGVSYSAWRRRRLRETNPQTAASTPQTAAPARNTGENGQAAADNNIRSVSAASAEPHGSGRRL